MPPRVAALLLAAGASRRMGQNKLLIDIGGRAVVRRVAEALLASGAMAVIAVTGHDGTRVRAALDGLPLLIVDNAAWADGMASSLRTGVAALPADADGVLVCLADMPAIDSDVIDRMIAAFDAHGPHEIIVPVHHGRHGNPVLFGRSLEAELMALTGDRGARVLIERYAGRVLEVDAPDGAIFADLDTPEAVADITSLLAHRDLLAAFRQTRYVVLGGHEEIVVHVGQPCPALDGILDANGVRAGSFVTAWNPLGRRQAESRNRAAMAGLDRALRNAGRRWLPATHRAIDPAWDEESRFVLGPSRDEAIGLARRWRQRAIIFVPRSAEAALVLV